MRPDLLLAHTALTRRSALGLAGTAAAAALTGLGARPASAAPAGRHPDPDDYGDGMFDVAAVEAGRWAPSRYGPDDQRGTFNEVTPARTAAALALLRGGRPTKTYDLGERMTNGFPAYRTTPPRVYEQRLTVLGYQPPAGFTEGSGILQGTEPLGPNRVSVHEERFPQGYTYQIVTQLDNLNHIGVGATFYNGFQGPDIAAPHGTTKLGAEHMGPIVTRGVLIDVLSHKLRRGEDRDLSTNADGGPVLRDDYRITVEDILAVMRHEGLRRIGPGDVVLFRTGWNTVARTEPDRYLSREPGIYLREARWLAAHKPAIIGSDTWALEVLGNPVVRHVFPVHQFLLVKYGIRIGEGIVTDELAADGVSEFVYLVTPQNAEGATAGNTPPAALAQPRRR